MRRLMEDLEWRGLVYQCTDPDVGKHLDCDSLTVYIGFDPTAPSLQLGNLVQILNLARFQRAGHRPIALAGGGTGMIGDPSGKAAERALQDRDTLVANCHAIRAQLARFLDFDHGGDTTSALLLDNAEWLSSLALVDFLRDIGKLFTVNQMIAKESVRARLEEREQGISYTEFSYMLLQAYDFLHLFDSHGCRMQVGASDQWGNITMGIELVRRLRGAHVFGMTTPLVTDAAGNKLGKTEAGAVWLDPQMTSPYQLFQYLVRTADTEVGTYLRVLTLLPRARIEELDAATAEAPERRDAQRALAWSVTALVHGDAEADAAQRASEVLFTEEVSALDEQTLLDVFAEAPSSTRSRTLLDGGWSLVDALAETGLFPSKGQARKNLPQGGVSINNRRETSVERSLSRDDLLHDRYVVLRRGRQHHLVRFE